MPVWGNPLEGVSKFKKALEKIEKHERSDIHRNAEKTATDHKISTCAR